MVTVALAYFDERTPYARYLGLRVLVKGGNVFDRLCAFFQGLYVVAARAMYISVVVRHDNVVTSTVEAQGVYLCGFQRN